jgi:hypothetical protein
MQGEGAVASSAPAVPMLDLHVSLSEDCQSLLLSPGEADFVNAVDVVLEGFVETCHVVERMLENEDLVCGVVEEESLEVQTAMRDLILDDEFEGYKAMAMQLLSTAYQNVVTFIGTFHPFRCDAQLWMRSHVAPEIRFEITQDHEVGTSSLGCMASCGKKQSCSPVLV